MPKLGMTMEEGTVVRWLKAEGEPVAKGETLLEVQTDKVTLEVESPAAGVLLRIIAPPGVTLPINAVIAYIGAPGEVVPAQPTLQPTAPPLAVAAPTPQHPPGVETGRVQASPAARRAAREHGLDLGAIRGSGPGGRIVVADVERAASSQRAVPTIEIEEEILPLVGVRKIVAERMASSFQSAPHFYLTRLADAQGLGEMRERLLPVIENQTGVRLTHSDLLVQMVARVLKRHPLVNAAWHAQGIRMNKAINIGLAVATPQGLIVPVIHAADTKTLAEIATRRNELVQKAEAGKLTLEDLEGGTFTLTNLGMFGVDAFNAILNPPQAALLAVGRIADRVVARDGQPVVRPTVYLTLSVDHRILDGANAAQFLTEIVAVVEEPYRLLV